MNSRLFSYRGLSLLTIIIIKLLSCLHHYDIFTKTGIKKTTAHASIFPKKGYFTGAHYFIVVVPILKVSITKGGSVYEMRARRYEEE